LLICETADAAKAAHACGTSCILNPHYLKVVFLMVFQNLSSISMIHLEVKIFAIEDYKANNIYPFVKKFVTLKSYAS